ncbi:PREDICTED: uncharacterized protein LOC108363089 [Rhagoletis zephyria]|uniref:uncharacterized protein LOC108363089 n=1 Tax=Rhagoletis zephyria TaxID=28612 RepID=UPI0008114F4D|nr:PREDICTED: uncharacterized protein LOC108363089 [Rhagoletis zephyria]
MDKLDAESQTKWEESVDYTQLSSWENCSEILSRRCQTLEARETKISHTDLKQTIKDVHRDSKPKTFFGKRNTSTALAIEHTSCSICHKGGHEVVTCPRFTRMSSQERYSAARAAKLCLVCLRKGHWLKQCSAAKCTTCNHSHHILLHRQDDTGPVSNEVSALENKESSSSTKKVALYTSSSTAVVQEVFLETAVILVKDTGGRYHPVRAILDSASQINLMCDYLAQMLRLPKATCLLELNGVSGVRTSITKKAHTVIKSRVNNYEVALQFYILPKITSRKPDQYVNVSTWNIPKNVELADPRFNTPARVDMLLGAEIFLELLCVGQIKLLNGVPRLQKTVFGWVVSGSTQIVEGDRVRAQSLVSDVVVTEQQDEKLNSLVERFWEMEQLSTKSTFLTDEEAECERIFRESVRRDDSGKFVVKIPFKNNVDKLGDSFYTAERRFLALERRLNKDSDTKKAYADFIEEYIKLGHMAKVAAADLEQLKYFSPHQHVLRPESTSTKLRVVFDCSCKTSSGLSLNDVMMKGPVVQDDLLSIVLRFRCFKFALTADVTKMYRQAWVTAEDCNYQAILWRNSSDERLAAYRLLTITYGTTAAPFLATRCLQQLGEDGTKHFPL